MTPASRSIHRRATLPQIERSVRAALQGALVLIETGYFMTAVDDSALRLVETLHYATWRRDDGCLMTGLPVGGLPTRLDLLEAEGLRCAVVGARDALSGSRDVIYVTGDRRDAPGPRTAASVLGIAPGWEGVAPRHPSPSDPESDASQQHHHQVVHQDLRDEVASNDDPVARADRLLDLRVELLAELWAAFLESPDRRVLVSLHAGEVLQRRAQRLIRRPVRRRREGDDVWSATHDEIIEDEFTSGRLVAEIARRLDRPTVLTAERLNVLGYPEGLWPVWDEGEHARCDLMIEAGADLPAIARSLRRSPWDIALTVATNDGS